jgi:hypothetical protein
MGFSVPFAAATATAALCSAASAGIVNLPVTFTWLNGSGGVHDQASFFVSPFVTEYAKFSSAGSSWDVIAVDVRDDSLTITGDFFNLPTTGFASGDTLRFELPATIAVDSMTLGAVSSVSSMDASRLSFSGNVMTIDVSQTRFDARGASFTVNFATSTVPGPAGIAVAALLVALPRRRR